MGSGTSLCDVAFQHPACIAWTGWDRQIHVWPEIMRLSGSCSNEADFLVCLQRPKEVVKSVSHQFY